MIPTTLSELYDSCKDELERRGWTVVYNADLNAIALASERKDGVLADIFIGYGVDEEISPKKLWYVNCKGEGRASFNRMDEAIKRFLEYCKDAYPKNFIDKSGAQEAPPFSEPHKSFSITPVIFGVMAALFIAGIVLENSVISFCVLAYILAYIVVRIIKSRVQEQSFKKTEPGTKANGTEDTASAFQEQAFR